MDFATLLCALFGFLFVRETPVPRRGPLRRRYPTAYQYSNSVYSTQAADTLFLWRTYTSLHSMETDCLTKSIGQAGPTAVAASHIV